MFKQIQWTLALGAGLLASAQAQQGQPVQASQPTQAAPATVPAPAAAAPAVHAAAPEATPQPGAERECLASFVRDNTIKPEAGPFRVRVDSVTQLAGNAQKETHLIEMTPPDGFRSRSTVNGVESQTVSLGTRTWVQAQGSWHAFPDVAPGATRELYHHYVDAGGLRALVCLPPAQWEGKAVRSYRFEYRQGPGMARTLARFDAATGRPLISETHGAAQPSSTRRFEFDPSIRIEPPQLD